MTPVTSLETIYLLMLEIVDVLNIIIITIHRTDESSVRVLI